MGGICALMGRSSSVAAAAIVLLCAAARPSNAAGLYDGDQNGWYDGDGASVVPPAAALDLPPGEDSLYEEVVGELDVDGVHLTSALVDDPHGDGARDHRHHHGHVRNLQIFTDDCEGIPSAFTETVYITLNDLEGKLDSAEEFEIFNQELRFTLNECAGKCVDVDQIDVLAQFFFEDRGRKRKWRRRAIIKAWAKGTCFQCLGGKEAQLISDSIGRLRRLGGAAETGERRLQQSCAQVLKRRLQRHNLEAFECLTIAELSLIDPRCEFEEHYGDGVIETRRLVGQDNFDEMAEDVDNFDGEDWGLEYP